MGTTSTDDKPRHPTAREYPALLKFLSRSYGFKDPRWFENDTSFFFGQEPAQLKTKWVLGPEGRFAAHIGLFPFTVSIEGRRLKAVGIGSVATDPDFRGRGLMKKLMVHVEERIKSEGYDLSILWGERPLYRPYGYERAVFQDQYTFGPRAFEGVPVPGTLRPAGPSDAPALDRMHRAHPFHTVRVPSYYKSLERRFKTTLPEPLWVLEKAGKVQSYALFHQPSPRNLELAEWGGEKGAVLGLLAGIRARGMMDTLSASLYPGSGLTSWANEGSSERVRSSRSCMVKPLDWGRILTVFSPQLKRRYGTLRTKLKAEFLFEDGHGQAVSLRLGRVLEVGPGRGKGERIKMTSAEFSDLLFGLGPVEGRFLEGVPESGILRSLFPLEWHWWRSDWV